MTLRLAVFDCDGTLVDSQHNIVAAMSAAWRAHGMEPLPRETVLRVVGLPLAEAIAALAPEANPERVEGLRASYVDSWLAMRAEASLDEPLFPGALAALDTLESEGWLLAIATGKSRRGLVATLDHHHLTDRFVSLQTADSGPGKPDPHMLLAAMSATGAAPANTVMIGDTSFDMRMARRAETFAVGVTWGYHEAAELEAAGAHALVDAFARLPQTMTRLSEGCPS